jgi:hypothetical protein
MRSENLENLTTQVKDHAPRLLRLSDESMQKTVRPGGWSGKEILGHLSDSAAMNRQRFIRSQYEALYDFPVYNQAKWVEIQGYKHYVWETLVAQWTIEYQHLIYMLKCLPDQSVFDKCPVKFGAKEFVTLDWLVGHIYRHNDHHLHQIYYLVGESDLPDPRKLNDPIEALP